MKKRRLITCLLSVCMVVSLASGCSSDPAAQQAAASPQSGASAGEAVPAASAGAVRTTAEREDALPGEAITPSDMKLQGLEEVGVIPQKKYFIAFSNGEMGNSFCRTFVDDMESIAKQYTDRFGVHYEWTNAGNNSTQQLSDIQSLLAKKPDVLLVSPNETEPLNVIVDWCNEAQIPLITIDKQLDRTPGEGYYIASISYDFFLQGVQIGAGIVDYLNEKYGEPKGDVAEIAGIMGASASIDRSAGMNLVLQQYPDINVVVMRAGEWDNSISYNAAQDILTTFPDGTIDVVVGNCDESCLAFMEAAKAAGRTDIGAGYVGADSPVTILDKITRGEAYATAENSPYYGYVSFEYAIRWLNGEEIPPLVMMPNRFFRGETEEQVAALKDIVEKCTAAGQEFVPAAIGYYDVFDATPDEVLKVYSTPKWQDPGLYEEIPYYATTPSTIR